MKKLVLSGVLTAGLALGLSAPASAIEVVAFDNNVGEVGGTLAFSTAPGGVLSVTDAAISKVANVDTLVESAIVQAGAPGTGCGPTGVAGCLNFTTGAFMSFDDGAVIDTYVFGPGGSLSITGNAVSAVGSSTNLYSTSFAGDVEMTVIGTVGTLQGLLSAGTIDPILAAYLGVDPIPVLGSSNVQFRAFFYTDPAGGGAITISDVQLVTNEVPRDVVPEPTSMLLLGTGLVGVASRLRRRKVR